MSLFQYSFFEGLNCKKNHMKSSWLTSPFCPQIRLIKELPINVKKKKKTLEIVSHQHKRIWLICLNDPRVFHCMEIYDLCDLSSLDGHLD